MMLCDDVKSTYSVRGIIVVTQLVNEELPDNGWSLPVLESDTRDSPYETL